MKHARFTNAFLLFYVSTREMKIKHTLAFKIFFSFFSMLQRWTNSCATIGIEAHS